MSGKTREPGNEVDLTAGNHGSCIYQNKCPVQDDEYNYHDSPLARLAEGTGNN